MMKKNLYLTIIFMFLFSSISLADKKNLGYISAPEGFNIIKFRKGSFSSWIQNLPLKENKTITAYDGSEISRHFYNIYSVVDMPLLFRSDLEQCADYCMRFWAEYHRQNNRLKGLYLFDYSGKKQYFIKSKKNFTAFLKNAMNYSNSHSLKKGCIPVSKNELSPGDMIVQNKTGGIGHVSMILNVCENKRGDRLYLIGYSFMPAQEFHIEKAGPGQGIKGWFTLEGYFKYLEENLPYGDPVLRRFK